MSAYDAAKPMACDLHDRAPKFASSSSADYQRSSDRLLAAVATCAPTATTHPLLTARGLSDNVDDLPSSSDNTAISSMHKRQYTRVQDYAISIFFVQGVKFQSSNGKWSSPHPLMSKFVQRLTVTCRWMTGPWFREVPKCTFDFAVVDGASAEAKFVVWVLNFPSWTVHLSWHGLISLDGTSDEERETIYLFQQCCDVKYNTTLSANFVPEKAFLSKTGKNAEAKLICEPGHGVIDPPTRECEEFYKTARARYDYASSHSFRAELLDGDLHPQKSMACDLYVQALESASSCPVAAGGAVSSRGQRCKDPMQRSEWTLTVLLQPSCRDPSGSPDRSVG
ncbi:uncharacterized protein L969DRAFT_79987 [Mixia osmundae IAM 14324]|uniref:Uncharacterized protein n=1 Tax=Mixia osmundae (strain CBS 9802 / IAM 14324 / JCM 22182 / KY 12970) TaxID=764103 RepID=G7DW96_MIXOS|nr:uncharacterized protein L969DRAFT_79987 [Mixia osmundae IAM 14324]KEI36517.1 hypothetical protein L969DRAFT_79987 [Mixia osmundae IAM 14324]GAA94784.1 hypothetical protein E5Q_01438 [Mixia osmundae IAM 14324]